MHNHAAYQCASASVRRRFHRQGLSTSISISKPGLCAEHSGRSFKVTTRRNEKRSKKTHTRASAIYLIAPVSVYVDSWQVLMRVAPRVMELLYCYYALWPRLCAFARGRASQRASERECMNYSPPCEEKWRAAACEGVR